MNKHFIAVENDLRRDAYHRTGIIAVILIFTLVNIRWLYLYRVGQAYDMDEAGYLTYALEDFRALASGGIAGWVQQIEAPSYQAPLTTLLTSLVFTVTGPSPSFGFVTMGLAGLATIVLGYAIGRTVGGGLVGVISAAMIACNPAVLNAVRGYSFAMPATAMLSLAVLAMLRSDGFRRAGWLAVFGLATGLLPLTRTVTIAFLPALGVAALLLALVAGQARRSLPRLVAAGFIALAVMAIWLVPNGRSVAGYLLQFGYGSRSAVYNPGVSTGLSDRLVFMMQYINAYVYLPAFLYIVAGTCLDLGFLVAGLVSGRRAGDASAHQRLALLVVVLGSLGVLMSTQNKGAAFATPLVPLLLVLATCGFMQGRTLRFGLPAACLAAAIAAAWPAVTMADLKTRLAWPSTANVPVLGAAVVSSGTGPVQNYEAAAGYVSDVPTMPVSAGDGGRWLEVLALTARTISDNGGDEAVTAFGARGYLYNTNEVNFAWMFGGHRVLPMVQVTPEVVGDSVDAYRTFLTGGDGTRACLLVTATETTGEIRPPITPSYMVEAARAGGFRAGPHWPLPDGREATLWTRQEAAEPCRHS